ncbi:MAG: hypothetical protein KJ864_02710, partial [Candidatus Omnitrophica bacterium]|nr:hypothetical protein [Candidatus Omnitrophota bacterium]
MKKTETIKYEIDPHNRLVYEKTGKKSGVLGVRTVLDGKFEIDKDNQLIYHVKKSQRSDNPEQLKLKGEWALDKDHNLTLTLDKWGNQIAGNKLTIESELISAKDNMLSFSVETRDNKNNTRIYIVKLGGRWQADEYNRFTFNAKNVKKETGITDRITLQGAWEVNRQNEIIYIYEKATAAKKKKTTHVVTLKGYWDIAGKHRIKYILNKEINSEFDFKVSVGKPVGRGLEYEIGVDAGLNKKTITLFGKWKINKSSGLLFEMPCAKGKTHGVILGGWAKLDKNHKLDLRLQHKNGEDLGIDIKLSR